MPHVLQLVEETEGASRLAGCASRLKAARQSLVQKPAVREHVEGLVGCFHIYRAEGVRPALLHHIEGAARRG